MKSASLFSSFARRFAAAALFSSFLFAAIGVLLAAPRAAQAQYEAFATRFPNPTGVADRLYAIALDTKGGVYVTGSGGVQNGQERSDVLTIKYDRYGVFKWSHRFSGTDPNGLDVGKRIVASPDGASVFVGANVDTDGNDSMDMAIYSLNAQTGQAQWSRLIDGTGWVPPQNDDFVDLAVTPSGDVIAVGAAANYNSGQTNQRDIHTVRFSGASGATHWEQDYSAGYVSAVAVDAARNAVYVTGTSQGHSQNEFTTLRYNLTTGALVWESFYDAGLDAEYDRLEKPAAIAVDKAGNVLVTGKGEALNFRTDAITVKYNGVTGAQAWAVRYSRSEGDVDADDSGTALVTDSAGDAYVAIKSAITNQYKAVAVTIRYRSATGTVIWERRSDSSAGAYYSAPAIALVPSASGGGCLVTGGGLRRYTSGGALAWENRQVGNASFAVDAATGATFIPGYAPGLVPGQSWEPSSDAVVIKIAPYAHGAAEASTGADGNTRVLWRKWDGGAVVRSYDAGGAIVAARTFAAPTGYRSRGLETGTDNKTRLVWENPTTGAVAVWTLSANLATTETGFTYAASGYRIGAISTGSDGKGRLLWAKPNGGGALWTLKTGQAGVESGAAFGPYASLAPLDIASGAADNKTRLAWKNNANGAVTLWTLNAGGTAPEFGKTYAAPAGYLFGGMNVASDNKPRLLWVREADRAAALWRLNPTGTALETGTVYGPIANVTPVAVASGRRAADTRTRILWQYDDGRAALWVLSANDGAVSSGVTLAQPAP